jgi:hypothetical protein
MAKRSSWNRKAPIKEKILEYQEERTKERVKTWASIVDFPFLL